MLRRGQTPAPLRTDLRLTGRGSIGARHLSSPLPVCLCPPKQAPRPEGGSVSGEPGGRTVAWTQALSAQPPARVLRGGGAEASGVNEVPGCSVPR